MFKTHKRSSFWELFLFVLLALNSEQQTISQTQLKSKYLQNLNGKQAILNQYLSAIDLKVKEPSVQSNPEIISKLETVQESIQSKKQAIQNRIDQVNNLPDDVEDYYKLFEN